VDPAGQVKPQVHRPRTQGQQPIRCRCRPVEGHHVVLRPQFLLDQPAGDKLLVLRVKTDQTGVVVNPGAEVTDIFPVQALCRLLNNGIVDINAYAYTGNLYGRIGFIDVRQAVYKPGDDGS